uniref:Uncharacterized protein n=1 Tax=Glossina palpalis gambiensis TaxID=67801 RepID=A0A1B0BWF3_9MUSC
MNGWMDGWMDGWLVGWLVRSLAVWLVGWLAGWLERHKVGTETKRSQPLICHTNKSSYDRYNHDRRNHSNRQLMISILLSKTDNLISFKRKES